MMNWKKKTPRDPKYLAWVRTLPCVICGKRDDIQVHHTETGGIGLKGSDYSVIPLCPVCHSRMETKKGKGIFAEGEVEGLVRYYHSVFGRR